MPESTTQGYAFAGNTASQYRNAAMQSELAVMQAVWESANTQVMGQWQVNKADADAALAAARKRLADLDALDANERAAKQRGENVSQASGNAVTVALLNQNGENRRAQAERAGENADRALKAAQEVDTRWNVPPQLQAAMANASKNTASAFSDTQAGVADQLRVLLKDTAVQIARKDLPIEGQRVLAANLADMLKQQHSRVDPRVINALVHNATGIAVDQFSRVQIEADKADAKQQNVLNSKASTGAGLSAAEQAALNKALGVEGDAANKSKGVKTEADKYFSGASWPDVKAELEKTGEVHAGEGTRPDGTKYMITPNDVKEYEALRTKVQESGADLGGSNANLFDDLFLSRVKRRVEAEQEVKTAEEKQLDVSKVPTRQDVQAVAGQIFDPYKTVEERKAEARAARRVQGVQGTDQQRATITATTKATEYHAAGDAWKNDGSDAQKKAATIRASIEDGHLAPVDAWPTIVKLAGDDKDLSADIYARVLTYHVAELDAQRVAMPKSELKPAVPPVSAVPPSDEDLKAQRPGETRAQWRERLKRRAMIEALDKDSELQDAGGSP